MTDFNVDIRIDDAQASAALQKVGREMSRVEQAGKVASETIKRGLADGSISADKAADAQKQLTAELIRSSRAGDSLATGTLALVNAKVRELTSFVGDLGLAGNTVLGLASAFASAASAVISAHVAMLAMNDALIEMRNRIRNVTASQTEFNFALANTRVVADRTLTGLDTTVDVFSRMSNATRELGLSQQHVSRLTETLSKMFQASGRSAGETSAAMLQLSQALGSGVLQGDEFRSLAENAPQLLTVFSRELGVTRGELKKLASEGKITTDVMIAGLDKMADTADRAFDRMEKTFSQKVRPLLNELQGDPNKINRAVSGNLSDAADLGGGMFNSGLLDGNLASSLLGGAQRIEIGVGAAAELGRAWEDLGRKLREMSQDMDATGRKDPWATPKKETLAFDLQVQQLVLNVEKLTGPKLITDGAQAWRAFGGMIGTFANNAVSDLSRVLDVLGDIAAPNGGAGSGLLARAGSAFKGLIEKEVEELKAIQAWQKTAEDKVKTLSAIEKLYKSIVGPVNDFRRDQALLNTLLARGKIDADQYTEALIRMTKALSDADKARVGMVPHSVLGSTAFGPQTALAAQLSYADPTAGVNLGNYDRANPATASQQAAQNYVLGGGEALARQEAIERSMERQLALSGEWARQAQQGADVMKAAFGSVEDALVKMATTGEVSFEKMIQAMMADLARLAANRLIMSLIGSAIGGPAPGISEAIASGVSPSAAYGGAHARGGTYRAPMTGGAPDSIPVFFHMSPGELATFTPQGQPPGGAANGNMRIVMPLDDRGRDLDTPEETERVVRIVRKERRRRA